MDPSQPLERPQPEAGGANDGGAAQRRETPPSDAAPTRFPTPFPISSFPDELVDGVLSYLDAGDLCRAETADVEFRRDSGRAARNPILAVAMFPRRAWCAFLDARRGRLVQFRAKSTDVA